MVSIYTAYVKCRHSPFHSQGIGMFCMIFRNKHTHIHTQINIITHSMDPKLNPLHTVCKKILSKL